MCLRGNVLTGKEESGLGGSMSDCFSELFPSFGGNCDCSYPDDVNKQANKPLPGHPDTSEDARAWRCFEGPGDSGK